MGAVPEVLYGSRALPLFLNRDNKYPVGLAMFAIAAAIYLTCNHFHLLPPQQLPRSWIDQMVPFMPSTVWIYLSEYVYFAAIYVACRDFVNLNKFFYSFLTLQFVSCLIFIFWPTTYPRDLFPLPDDLSPATWYVFSALRQADTAANCCPSLHVSSVYLSAFLFLEERKGLFPFFFVWATAITASTLTTKQHYLVDAVAGFLLAMMHYWLFHRWMAYRRAR